ncbi:MAG: HAD family hydrolase [Dissulfurispiraceae bacterium]
MIQVIIFDLDGVIVKTERLKAISYAKAATSLLPGKVTEDQVIEAYKEVVGRSRQDVAVSIMRRFALEKAASNHLAEFGVSEPWQAFVRLRLPIYEAMVSDPDVLLNSQWPQSVSLVRTVRKDGYRTALGTTSDRRHSQRVLEIIGLADAFDFITTADDVKHGKPDPEIYRLISQSLDIAPAQCLVLEDSPSGIKAALTAGMACIAVTNPFTRQVVHEAGLLEAAWIVDEPESLHDVVARMLHEKQLAKSSTIP